MQEDGTVAWDPIVEVHLPWQERILILFLVVVVLVIVAKWVRFAMAMFRARRAEETECLWMSASCELMSMKNWLKLALLATGLCVASSAADVFRMYTREKIYGTGAMYSLIAGWCVEIGLGLMIVTGGFVACMLGEWWMRRRREKLAAH